MCVTLSTVNFICDFNIQALNTLRSFCSYHQTLSALTSVTSLLVPLSSLPGVLSHRGISAFHGAPPQVITMYVPTFSFLSLNQLFAQARPSLLSPSRRALQQVCSAEFPCKKWQICIIAPCMWEFHTYCNFSLFTSCRFLTYTWSFSNGNPF